MTAQGDAIHLIETLPDDATWGDVQESVHLAAGVWQACHALVERKAIPPTQLRAEFAAWFAECLIYHWMAVITRLLIIGKARHHFARFFFRSPCSTATANPM